MALANAVNGEIKQTTYTAANTWTPDARMKYAKIYIWNGGNGGGSGRCGVSATAGGGSGGGPGNLCIYDILSSSLTNAPYAVTIGAGGNGGTSINAVTTSGNPGAQGGTSSLGTTILGQKSSATEGIGLGGSTANVAGGLSNYDYFYPLSSLSGGIGGVTTGAGTASSGNYFWATGGGGGAGYSTTTARVGGAGGTIFAGDGTSVLTAGGLAGDNAGNVAGNGNPATANDIWWTGGTGGGGGGHDGALVAGTGGNGAIPSGGGGGGAGNLSSNASGAGGNGARGQIVIIEFLF